MAIWYVDFEGEAGTGDGTSFANRARSIRALYNIASERDSGENDSSGGSNGANSIAQTDEIRVKKSPDPTSMGAGQVWKDVASGDSYKTINGTPQITYSTTKGQTNIKLDYHSLETGDWIKLSNNSNTDAYINGFWKITRVDQNNFTLDEYKANSSVSSTGSGGNVYEDSGNIIELDNKLIEEVAFCSRKAEASSITLMTPQTNVNVYPSSNDNLSSAENNWGSSHPNYNGAARINPESGNKIVLSSSFTGTGKAAHMQLPSTLDLSAYQQISLQMFFRDGDRMYNTYENNPTYITQGFSLRLCSDNNGDTTVHTIPLNYYKIRSTYRLTQIVKDFGTNLSNNINSIAIYVDTARNITRTFDIGNIIACKNSSSADALTHDDLVGLHTAAAPQWYNINAIWNANGKTIIKCEEGADEVLGYSGLDRKGITPRYWPQSYNANVSGNTSTTIYRRIKFWFQHYALNFNQNSNASKFLRIASNNHPLIISGGWNATDMSTKTAGDITCIDGATCEIGDAYISSCNGQHSGGSGGGYHADGEDKRFHFEDFYLTRFYGYWQFYRRSFSMLNVGVHNWLTGFYFYFTYGIKKCGLTCLSGFSEAYSSYHGINFGLHSQGSGLSNATFLTNSDGSYHSTYDHTTRYIKWAAGARENIVRIGHGATNSQIDKVRFSVINCEHSRRDAGLYIQTGTTSRLQIDECKVGYCDYKGNTTSHLNLYCDPLSPVYIGNLTTTLCYSGFRINNRGYIDIQNWVDEDFGIKKNSIRYRGEGYWSYGYACQVYETHSTVVCHDGVTGRQPIFYNDSRFFAESLLVDNNDGIYNHSGTVELKDYGNISGNNYKMFGHANVYGETSVRRTSSGYSLKFENTHNLGGDLKLATIIFNGGTQVTVKIYLYKTHQDMYGTFACKNFTINSGLSMEALVDTEYNTNNTNQWLEKTITFTPSAAGSCDIFFHVKGGTGSGHYLYLDDLSVSQV
mgnify:FL=1